MSEVFGSAQSHNLLNNGNFPSYCEGYQAVTLKIQALLVTSSQDQALPLTTRTLSVSLEERPQELLTLTLLPSSVMVFQQE